MEIRHSSLSWFKYTLKQADSQVPSGWWYKVFVNKQLVVGGRSCAIMIFNKQDRQCDVMLSAAKHLTAHQDRCFAALSMT
jgi:hypothetical protein